MRRNFVELQKILERRFPQLIGNIHGENYPPSPQAMLAVQVAGMLQMGAVAVMFFGSSLFQVLGMPEPEFVKYMQENKLMTFSSVFMMNSMATSMTKSGAFEIMVDGQVVYSKLRTGQMPTVPQIIRAFEDMGIAPM